MSGPAMAGRSALLTGLIIVLVAILLIGAGAWLVSATGNRGAALTGQRAEGPPGESQHQSSTPGATPRAKPQSPALGPNPDTEPEPTAPRMPEQKAVTDALDALQWDDRGRLQVDAAARADLDAVFMESDQPLSADQFQTLRDMIATGLPDDRRNPVLEVVDRYYHYSNVYRDLADGYRHLQSVEDMESGFRQVQRLRRDYLGPELAEALFGDEERMTRTTLENMRVQSDSSLSEQQKKERERPLSEAVAAEQE